ncbi:hypothetical protein WH47_08441 [Habropoda laboriosa]|uniref:Uncharacterized protein n=1 Tax=Habropoda laboriosa TaxID=597456 RepID=A0A0L7RG04_9HYME|nr:hypothetical protein WH47_08441 [Habropoda laboriosa]
MASPRFDQLMAESCSPWELAGALKRYIHRATRIFWKGRRRSLAGDAEFASLSADKRHRMVPRLELFEKATSLLELMPKQSGDWWIYFGGRRNSKSFRLVRVQLQLFPNFEGKGKRGSALVGERAQRLRDLIRGRTVPEVALCEVVGQTRAHSDIRAAGHAYFSNDHMVGHCMNVAKIAWPEEALDTVHTGQNCSQIEAASCPHWSSLVSSLLTNSSRTPVWTRH